MQDRGSRGLFITSFRIRQVRRSAIARNSSVKVSASQLQRSRPQPCFPNPTP